MDSPVNNIDSLQFDLGELDFPVARRTSVEKSDGKNGGQDAGMRHQVAIAVEYELILSLPLTPALQSPLEEA